MTLKKVKVLPVNKTAEKQSLELLKSLVDEQETTSHPYTRVGAIVEVRNEKEGDKETRLYVLSFSDGYVYMPSDQGPEEFKALSDEEIVGYEVPFKVVSVDKKEKKIYVSFVAIMNMYAVAYQKGEKLRGVINSHFFDERNFKDSYFVIRAYGDIVKMKITDFSAYNIPKYLPVFTEQRVEFKVLGVDDEGIVWVTKKALEEEQRDKTLKELKDNEAFVAQIVKVTPKATYLLYKDILLTLNDGDFSTDHTPVALVKKKGDSMLVKIKLISKSNRVFVIPEKKYTAMATLSPKDFNRGEIMNGTVIKRFNGGYFVRVVGNVDVYCPVPRTIREPEINERVKIKITRVYDRKLKDGTTLPSAIGAIKGFVANDEGGR